MRRNPIISNIERVQTKARLTPATVSSYKAHEARESARTEAAEEAAKEVAGMALPKETGGIPGIAEKIAAAAKARGFKPKREITIEFIKNADGEIVGAKLL